MKFYFKAEANEKIGGGHLHRCISIAKEIHNAGHEVSFVFSDSTQKTVTKVKNLGWMCHVLPKNRQLDSKEYLSFISSGSFILFDTDNPMFYSGELIDSLRKSGITTACYTITDEYPISTDILINTNVISSTHKYQTPAYTQKIIGAKYLIFNEQFRKLNTFDQAPKSTKNALIFLGNADFHQITQKVLHALNPELLPVDQIHVLIGNLNRNKEHIKLLVQQLPFSIIVHENVKDMNKIYSQTDIAITSAGMTMWEMALYGIPQLVIASSERENTYTKYLADKQYIEFLGTFSESNTFLNITEKLSKHSTKSNLDLSSFKELLHPNGITLMVSKLIKITTHSR